MQINTKTITDALLWPIRDVPRIFEVGQRGFAPAIPAFVELGIVAAFIWWQPFGKSWEGEIGDVAVAYGSASAASFLLKGL